MLYSNEDSINICYKIMWMYFMEFWVKDVGNKRLYVLGVYLYRV